MKRIHFFIIVACFWYYHSSRADKLLTFFFNPYPTSLNEEQCKEALEDVTVPGRLAEYCVYGILDKNLVSGIFVTYAGFLGVSDEIGQITLPLLHTKPIVRVLVTNRLTPIMMIGHTLHHWEVEKDNPAMLYEFEKKFNASKRRSYWNVRSADLPANRNIATDTVVILAQPQFIYVPLESTVIEQESPHYILPNMYVKKGINREANALYMLNLSHYYSPVQDLNKLEPARYLRLLNI